MRIRSAIFSVGLLSFAAISATVDVRAEQRFHIENGVKYEILDEELKTVGLASLEEGAEDYLFLPASIEIEGTEYRVTQINDYAFANNPTFYYITFPEGLEKIGSHSFSNCPMIMDMEFPSTLESIGDYAFYKSNSIEKLHLPASLNTLGAGAFSEMEGLKKVVMQDCALTDIPDKLFYNSKELNEVYLPLGVKRIGNHSFEMTLSLTDLYFPEGLESIGERAFCGQPYAYGGYAGGLSKISLPSTITEIGKEAFRSTPIFEADLSKTSLIEIKESTFSTCYNLSSIILPESLEAIRTYAFSSCGSNSSIGMIGVVIPESVVTIEQGAFNDCKITSVKVGCNVTNLPKSALGSPTNLELGEGLKSIDVNAFYIGDVRLIRLHSQTPPSISSNYNLTEEQRQNITVVVDDGCLALYSHHPIWSAFNLVEDGKSRVEVTLDGSIGLGEAIYNQSGVMPSRVTALKISGKLSDTDMRVINENMFSLTELDIEDTDLTEIADSQFAGMTLLTNVVLPKNLKKINAHAFSGCRSLKIKELPDGIESIGVEAFEGCSSLQISRLPESLRIIYYRAFSECISLRSIVAGKNLEDFGQASFSSCRMLEYVDLSATKITELKSNALYICETLRTLLLPPTLNKFDYRALAITGLRSLEIPGAVTILGPEVFFQTPLRAVAFGEGLTTLPQGVFEDCRYLVSASMPSTLQSIGANMFKNNSRLRMMSCAATEAPAAETGAFNGILTQKSTLTIPKGSFFSYISAPQWGLFANIDASLEVNIAPDVDVTVIPEEEYQEIEEEERLLQEQLENEAKGDESETPEMQRRRLAARAATSSALLDGSQFAKVFNGFSLNRESASNSEKVGKTDKGNRFFISAKNSQEIEAILYNGEDITNQLVDGVLILPSNAEGLLEIRGKSTGIDSVATDVNENDHCAAYTLTGVKVYEGVYSQFASSANAGIYIVHTSDGASKKVAVK